MSILEEILKRDRESGRSDEKLEVFDLNKELLEELRLMPWLVTPEEYEILCPLCNVRFSPMVRSGAVVICGNSNCRRSLLIVEPKQGVKWIHFNGCRHVVKESIKNQHTCCPKCGTAETVDGSIYYECEYVPPKRIEEKEAKLRGEIYTELISAPCLVVPQLFKVKNCAWGCGNINFVPERSSKLFCIHCSKCAKPCPVVRFSKHKWGFCKQFHLNLVPSSETKCPQCGADDFRESSIVQVEMIENKRA